MNEIKKIKKTLSNLSTWKTLIFFVKSNKNKRIKGMSSKFIPKKLTP